MKYFIKPIIELSAKDLGDAKYFKNYKTYSQYNYLQPNIISYLKRLRFEIALQLTKQYFHSCNVIDFGCADGFFLPSLSKYFNHVCGIDIHNDYIRAASKLVNENKCNNVELICNNGLTINDVKQKLGNNQYKILYLLEIIEHIGEKDSLYQSKIEFLKELFSLIDRNGIIVISVPKMVGIFFFIKHTLLSLMGYHQEKISINNLLKASFLNDTSELEKNWDKGHLGFNHKKLEENLKNEFDIVKKRMMMFSVIYAIERR